ncbi:hypothetical protein VCHA53O466_40223 [Vibrio chagasii]|nr:hypothetical protein VCHA53O466_40223 [Vibrio chagasii]
MLLDRLFNDETYVYNLEELSQRKVLPLPNVSDFACSHVGLKKTDTVPVYITRPKCSLLAKLLDGSTFESESSKWFSSFCSSPRAIESLESSFGREEVFTIEINGSRFDYKVVVRRDLSMQITNPRTKKVLFNVSTELIAYEVEVVSTLYKKEMLCNLGAPYEDSLGNYKKKCLVYSYKEDFDNVVSELRNGIDNYLEMETKDFHAKGLVTVPCGLDELRLLSESIDEVRSMYERGVISHSDYSLVSAIMRGNMLATVCSADSDVLAQMSGVIASIKSSDEKTYLNAILIKQLKISFLEN